VTQRGSQQPIVFLATWYMVCGSRLTVISQNRRGMDASDSRLLPSRNSGCTYGLMARQE